MACWVGGWGTHTPRGGGGMGGMGYSYAQGCGGERPAGWVAGVLIRPGVCGGMACWVGGWGTHTPRGVLGNGVAGVLICPGVCEGMACWVGGWGTHMPWGVWGYAQLGGWLGYS